MPRVVRIFGFRRVSCQCPALRCPWAIVNIAIASNSAKPLKPASDSDW